MSDQVAEAIAAERESPSPACRADPARLERLLAPDFHEFGTSGGEFVRAGMAELVASDPGVITVVGLRGWLVADGVVMVKYTSECDGRWSNRTSLWRRVAPGEWQMFHHQGTPTTPH